MMYYVNEAAFELPDLAFADRTVNVLEATTPEGGEVGVLIARTTLPAGTSLRDVVDAHQDQERRTLRAWAVVSERDGEIDGAPLVEVAIQWRGDDGMVYQRQAHVGLSDQVMLVVVNGPLEDRAACDACMDRVLGSMKLRTGV
jgi:hypothetical protein